MKNRNQITICNMDPKLIKRIQAEAKRLNLPLARVAEIALQKGMSRGRVI